MCMYVCVCMYVYVCIYVCMYVSVCTCVCIYIYIRAEGALPVRVTDSEIVSYLTRIYVYRVATVVSNKTIGK